MISHKAIVGQLQKQKRWLVRPTNTTVDLTKKIAGHAVSIYLTRNETGNYDITPLSYTFHSNCSHFDFFEDESRYTRNKNSIIAIVTFLKEMGIWKYVDNKTEFVRVNIHNSKSKKDAVSKQLLTLLEDK